MNLDLAVLPSLFAVCQLPPDSGLPNWASKGQLSSVTKTPEELSIVCDQEFVPENIKTDNDWKAIKVKGPLDFSLVGILADLSSTLAKARVSIFAISTYNTDYILVKESSLETAVKALTNSGHSFAE